MSPSGAPEPRIGDADREAAVAALGEHYAAGRLSKEEFDERSDQAWTARTASGLWPLFADLPRPGSARSAAPVAPPAPPPHGAAHWSWGRLPTPLLVALVVLAVLTALIHLPLILLGVGIWFFASRSRHGSARCQQRRLR